MEELICCEGGGLWELCEEGALGGAGADGLELRLLDDAVVFTCWLDRRRDPKRFLNCDITLKGLKEGEVW